MTTTGKRSPITGITRFPMARASRIEEAGHDQISGVIEVRFKTGAVWQYHGFDAHTFEAFLRAGDQQAFFDREIFKRQAAQRHVMVSQNEDTDPRRTVEQTPQPKVAV